VCGVAAGCESDTGIEEAAQTVKIFLVSVIDMTTIAVAALPDTMWLCDDS
jgi:hypothetical protein